MAVETPLDTLPMFAKPTVKINGNEMEMRRLHIDDLFEWLRMILRITARGDEKILKIFLTRDIANIANNLGTMFFTGLSLSRDLVKEWLGSLIGMDLADVSDPEKFPLGSELKVIKAFLQHPDLKAFFLELQDRTAMEAFRAMVNPLVELLTPSKQDTDGQTT